MFFTAVPIIHTRYRVPGSLYARGVGGLVPAAGSSHAHNGQDMQRSSEYQYLRVPVISAFSTLGTREDSVISAFSTLGTREDSVTSAFSALGTRENSVISASGTLGTHEDSSDFNFWYPRDS